jgi:hypothetical protein
VVRSPQAPERLAFDLDLPAGATTTVLPEGSIGIEQDGRTMAALQQPLAHDADGQRLDVTATVADGQLVFSLAHQGKDLAYPLLVDPYWAAYWNWHDTSAGPGPWHPTEASGRYWYTTDPVMGNWGRGMYVYQCCSQYYDLYQDGYWEFVAPGTSWIQRIDYNNLGHYDGGSAPGPATACQIAWLWSSDWTQQASVPQMCVTAAGHNWTQCVSDTCNFPSSPSPATSRGNRARIGEIMWAAGYRYGWWSYMGASQIYLGDDDMPTGTMTGPTGPAQPTDTIQVTANDPGLGIARVVFSAPGQPDWNGAKTVSGTNCDGYCDHDLTATTTVGNLRGTQTIQADIYDLAHTTPTTKTITMTAVDTTAPTVTPDGSFFWMRSLQSSRGAEIGGFWGQSAAIIDVSGTDEGSGVAQLQVTIDGQPVATQAVPCTAGCPPAATLSHKILRSAFAPGNHAIEVSTTDAAGNRSTRTFDVYFPNESPEAPGDGTTTEELEDEPEPTTCLPSDAFPDDPNYCASPDPATNASFAAALDDPPANDTADGPLLTGSDPDYEPESFAAASLQADPPGNAPPCDMGGP